MRRMHCRMRWALFPALLRRMHLTALLTFQLRRQTRKPQPASLQTFQRRRQIRMQPMP